ncbi:response regulator [Planctomyces sp. SH-PL14]|uniref:response regulator n=1 Tax=Planctomyces sp. SH-PL14 TaxID=1632864 RepID=UPI00078D4DD3|nr:response regulator [Planctomyces sp. SH-PL14]AMV18299.1 hypothetical protein VT03_10445 [Planctomyces sp. SH-PL14]
MNSLTASAPFPGAGKERDPGAPSPWVFPPEREPRAARTPAAAAGPAQSHLPFALLCEEDPETRALCEEACLKAGFRVLSARNARDVIGHLSASRPRVLIVAHDLSYLSFASVAAIANEWLSPSAFLIATGNVLPCHLSRATGLPELRCLQRPVRRCDLLNALAWIVTQ